MSKQLYIVYETDEWHSTASRDCKGVFMSKTSAIRSITKNHSIKLEELFDLTDIKMTPSMKKSLEKEARQILRNELDLIYQTQGYSTNYVIEIYNANEWC